MQQNTDSSTVCKRLFQCDDSFSLQAQQLQDSTNAKRLGNASGLRILLRSKLFKRLTVCLMVSGVVTDGLSDLFIQYFKLLFNFSVRDVVSTSSADTTSELLFNKCCQ